MPAALRWLLGLGPLNPIAVRLVQNASRRSKHLYVRSAYLGVLIVVLLWLLLTKAGGTPSYRTLAEAGASSFTIIAYLQITLICILAPVFMASAIAQEANPKTWDILLTTPLGRLQIVLGNLFGRLFFVLALLFASLPLFALTQFFGGVPGGSIFASYLVAACTALLVGATAIALSVSRLVGRRAVFTFYIAVVSYMALTALADRLVGGFEQVTWLTGLNPFLALRALLNPKTYLRADPAEVGGLAEFFLARPVTAWCVLSTTLSLALISASSLTVRSGGLTSAVATTKRRRGQETDDGDYRAPRPVGLNPIAWRESTARNATFWRVAARWAFVAAGALAGLAVVLLYHTQRLNDTDFRGVLAGLAWMETGVITLIAVNTAATAISKEREDGTLDLLLTTPITPAMYLSGKLRGLVAYLIPLLAVPIGTFALAGLYAQFGGFGRPGGATISFAGEPVPVVLPESALVVAAALVPFTAFCVMVGLQWSLKSKGTIGSVVSTVAVVGVAASIVGLCGYNAGRDVAAVGPALAALNPVTAIAACVSPEHAMEETLRETSLIAARVALLAGAAVGVGLYAAVVFGIHAGMAKGFDFTVRKLAGTR